MLAVVGLSKAVPISQRASENMSTKVGNTDDLHVELYLYNIRSPSCEAPW